MVIFFNLKYHYELINLKKEDEEEKSNGNFNSG